MSRTFIVAAGRTPIGAFGGVFKDFSAVKLGESITRGILERYEIPREEIDELIVGNVLSAGMGMNPARQVGIGSGINETVPMYSVNQVCGSGLKAVGLAAQSIRLEESELVVAGGIENMSQAPYYLPALRWGGRMGPLEAVDYMINEGLTDVFHHVHMGITAEYLAEKYSINREDQDRFAWESQMRCKKAMEMNAFLDETIPVSVPQRKGDPIVVLHDEHPRPDITLEKLAKMAPAFKKDGTVTAANASGVNDGAAMVVLAGEKKIKKLGLKPLAEILGFAQAGVAPMEMGLGPVPAIQNVLSKTGLKLKNIDLLELNEAFAVQTMAVNHLLEQWAGELDHKRINVHGGAIALGHPIGASGARILATLLFALKTYQKKLGLASLCVGGGMGIAMVIRNL